jgi:hypothetical protein
VQPRGLGGSSPIKELMYVRGLAEGYTAGGTPLRMIRKSGRGSVKIMRQQEDRTRNLARRAGNLKHQ